MSDLENISLKNVFLKSLIVSVGLSAVLGIFAVLIGDFGEFEVKVLVTTLTISAASLCGLCCGAAIELRGQRDLGLLGIGLAGIAAVLVISGIWAEARSDTFWKTTATFGIFAVSFAHLSLLTLAHLSERYEWAIVAAFAVVLAVALVLTGILWGELDENFILRLLGVLGILDGAITILIPIFHRLSEGELRPQRADSIAELDKEIAQLEARLSELQAKRQAARNQPDA